MGIKIFSPLSYSEGKLYGLSPSTPSATTLDLTFARNSTNRTRVSNRGVVQDVPYNLLSFSEEFDNTAWTKTQSTVTPNAVQPPNNPNYTADLVYPTGSTAFIQTSGTTTTASGGTYYFSVYARAAGKNFIMLNGSGGTTGVWYNLSTGVIGTQSAGNGYILNMGNGWYYCVWFGNLTGALQPIIRISDADNSTSNTASGTNGVFLWGAQLSQSTAVQPYFKTTNRLNVPAIDYSLSTGGSGCLLMEPQRTNLLLNSGTLSTQSVTVSAVQHTLSFYGTGTTALSGAFTGGLTGTTATGRVSLTFTPTAGTLTLTVTGVITNAQLEVGAYPTSYIPTTAASATRAADSFTRNSLFSNNYVTAAGGTWFVDLDNNIALARDAADVGLFLGDTATGTTNSFCINTPSGSSRMEIDSYVNGSATTLHVTTTDRTRAAIKWNGSTADVFVNGSKVVSGTTFTGTTLEYMGLNVRDTPKYIRGMWLAPVPLTDADLAMVTTVRSTTPPLLLDLYTGAAAAYSLRKLRTSYTGAAIRVRRSTDNTEQDIGFTSSGDLDTIALANFVGAGDGFIRTWYDQSGTNNHATQTGTTNQPRIVISGVLQIQNNSICINFTAANSNFLTLTNYFSGSAGSRFATLKLKQRPTTQATSGLPIDEIGSSNNSSYYTNTSGPLADDFASTTRKDPAGDISTAILTSKHLYTTISIPNQWTNWVNNTQIFNTTTNTVGYKSTGGTPMIGGGLGFVTNYIDGYLFEIIVYTNNQSSNRLNIIANTNLYYQIY